MIKPIDDREDKKTKPQITTFPISIDLENKKKKKKDIKNISNNQYGEEIHTKALKLHSEGKIHEAMIYYQKCIEKSYFDPQVLSNYGTICQRIGDHQKALGLFKKLSDLYPNDPTTYSNIATSLKSLGNIKEAEIYLRNAIKLKPDFAIAYYNLGTLMKSTGNFIEAEINLKNAIKYQPDFAMAYFNLGNLMNELKNIKEAELNYLKTIEHKPNHIEAKILLENISRKRVPKWHIPMMNDYERNNSYLNAMKLAIKESEFVLEIGTGSGLLSMMAVDCGAGNVITCESSLPIAKAAEKIIEKNNFSKKIKVINKKSTDLILGNDLPQKADLIISEIISSEFVGEGVQPSLIDANKRLLKENGTMIPESGEIRIALLKGNSEIQKELFVETVNGYDLSEFNNIMGKKFILHYLGRKEKIELMSEVNIPFSFSFYEQKYSERTEKILHIPIKEDGQCLGIITWIKLKLYKDVSYENKPSNTCTSGWVNPIYKFNQPLAVKKGQVIKIKASLIEDSVWYEFIETL